MGKGYAIETGKKLNEGYFGSEQRVEMKQIELQRLFWFWKRVCIYHEQLLRLKVLKLSSNLGWYSKQHKNWRDSVQFYTKQL